MPVLDELLALGWPHTLITLEEWDALPEDRETKVECVEGMVVMVPPTDSHHQRAVRKLLAALSDVLPHDLEALSEVGVLLERDQPTIRIPDVSVVGFDESQVKLFAAADVHLAIEVVSPGSRRIDHAMKLGEYAEAGVPEYWILDRDDLVLSTFGLRGSAYELTGEHRDTADIATCGVRVRIDVPGLISR